MNPTTKTTPKDFFKKNFALVLAFLLPLILIIVVALVTYLPVTSVETKYNFIYAACFDGTNYYPYYCNDYIQKRYIVVDDKLVLNDIDLTQDTDKNGVPDYKEKYSDRIFFHNTEKNESIEISLKETQAMTLSNLLTSPDGITVSNLYDRRGGDFIFPFFFDRGYSSYGYYLTKGKGKSKLNLINNNNQYYYQNNFKFIGWVLSDRN